MADSTTEKAKSPSKDSTGVPSTKESDRKVEKKASLLPYGLSKSDVFMLLMAVVAFLFRMKIFDPLITRFSAPRQDEVIPPIRQANFSIDVEKRQEIVLAFKGAWGAYERDAMGFDNYHPLSRNGSNLVEAGGIGYTVVDALDTMQIMGLEDEFKRARSWVANNLTFDRDGDFNTFEITIRVLGGLLTAYHLSDEDPIFLEKAKDLADRIMPAFDTPYGLPLSLVNLAQRKGISDPGYPGLVSTAEVSTIQLEFRYLSWLTDDDDYWDKAEGVMKVIKATNLPSGLAPIFLSADTGQFLFSEIRLGSRGDSFYEYLLKQYLQTVVKNYTEPAYLNLYQRTMEAIHTTLLQKGINHGLTYTTEVVPDRQGDGHTAWRLSPKQDHLVCFLGGSLMLGATTTGAVNGPGSVSVPPRREQLTETGEKDWKLGEELIKTCMDTYNTATGLSAEIVHFYTADNKEVEIDKRRDWYIKGNGVPGQPSYDARYILRPETVESLFIAYRLTGNDEYRAHGWRIFEALKKSCRLDSGAYASIFNVDDQNTLKFDKMESFFLSETLKYLYLLFSDASVLSLDKYVFNTEAHPLPIFTPLFMTGRF